MNKRPELIMRIGTYFVILAVFAVSLSAASIEVKASDIFRWVDEAGVVHYGERPPADQESDRLNLHYAKPDDDASEQLEKIDSTNRAKKEKERIMRKEREQALRQARIRQQNCDNARKNIRALSRNTSTKYRQKDGSYRRYSGEEHQAQMEKARQAEREYCYGN